MRLSDRALDCFRVKLFKSQPPTRSRTLSRDCDDSESPVAAQQTRYPAGSGPQAPAVRGSEPPPRRGRPPARRGRAFPGRVSDSNFSPGFTPKLEFKSRIGSETAACGL